MQHRKSQAEPLSYKSSSVFSRLRIAALSGKILFVCLLLLPGILLQILIIHTQLSYDEASWAYVAMKLVEGKQLFTDVIITTPVFVLIPYLIVHGLHGSGFGALHGFGIVWNTATMVCMMLLARYLWGWRVAVFVLVIGSVYTVAYPQGGHFLLSGEQVSQLPLFLSLLILQFATKQRSRRLFFLSGVLMGITWNIREAYLLLHGAVMVYILYGIRSKRVGWVHGLAYGVGSLVPILSIVLYFFLHHQLDDFFRLVIMLRLHYLTDTLGSDFPFWTVIGRRMLNLFVLVILAALSWIYGRKKSADSYRTFSVYLLFLCAVVIMVLMGKRLHSYYFLYLTYSLILPAAHGLDLLIEKLGNMPAWRYRLGVGLLGMFFLVHGFVNVGYLDYLRRYAVNRDDPYRLRIYDGDLLDFLDKNGKHERVLFLGYSAVHYYYYTSRYTERMQSSYGLYLFYAHGYREWQQWFGEFRENPAAYIIIDPQEPKELPDALDIPEFSQYVKNCYVFLKNIHQYQLFMLVSPDDAVSGHATSNTCKA